MNIWYEVKIKSDLPKLDKFKHAQHLFVKVDENEENEMIGFTIWNGNTEGKNEFEHLDLNEAIDHLQTIKDEHGNSIKYESEALDLDWFKCIHPDWKYRNR